MDLLGYLRQEGRDERYPYQEGNLEAKGRDAQALLLGRLYSPLKASRYILDIMNYSKGFAAMTALLIVFGIIVLGGIGYVAVHPEVLKAPAQKSATTSGQPSIVWHFENMGEVDAMPQTKVTVTVNGTAYEAGTFAGGCSEIGASGGIDGKGLVAGELSAAQCWFAGGGNEIGVFAHEDGGYQIMVGDLSEGDSDNPMFRGDFKIKTDIKI